MSEQNSYINLDISIEEIQNNFPEYYYIINNMNMMNLFILNNSIIIFIRGKLGWTVSNTIYDYIINKPEYSRIKNEVDSITDYDLLIKFNIFCVRNIMNFLRPTFLEHMGKEEANEKLNNVWKMALPDV